MLHKVLTDPNWAQAATNLLIAAIGLGTLLAVSVTAILAIRERRERGKPIIEIKLPRPHKPEGWWIVDIAMRNFSLTTIEATELLLVRPPTALLMNRYQPRAGNMDNTVPEGDRALAVRRLPLRMSAGPPGTLHYLPTRGGSTAVAGDVAHIAVLLFVPPSRQKSAVTMRLYWSRMAHPNRLKSTTIHITISAPSSNNVA